MAYYLLKLFLSAAIIVAVSELAKRYPTWAGALASLPLISLLAIVWLYLDTRDPAKVIALSTSIFWLVLPSLLLFIVLPVLLRSGFGFTWSLTLAMVATLAGYGVMLVLLKYAGLKIS